MKSLGDIISERLLDNLKYPEELKEYYKEQSKEETKKRNHAIDCFRNRVNKQRQLHGYKPLSFLAVKMKMYAFKELDELRWFWKYCEDNGQKFDKDGKKYTFSRIFFASLDTKKFTK